MLQQCDGTAPPDALSTGSHVVSWYPDTAREHLREVSPYADLFASPTR